mmetsp:Transcript_26732/g.36759  ORF Transcript_26732/g.36759 Transcript_26732/m.36759 type:complete len:341 (-) Transcript_26732:941-1963(-)
MVLLINRVGNPADNLPQVHPSNPFQNRAGNLLRNPVFSRDGCRQSNHRDDRPGSPVFNLQNIQVSNHLSYRVANPSSVLQFSQLENLQFFQLTNLRFVQLDFRLRNRFAIQLHNLLYNLINNHQSNRQQGHQSNPVDSPFGNHRRSHPSNRIKIQVGNRPPFLRRNHRDNRALNLRVFQLSSLSFLPLRTLQCSRLHVRRSNLHASHLKCLPTSPRNSQFLNLQSNQHRSHLHNPFRSLRNNPVSRHLSNPAKFQVNNRYQNQLLLRQINQTISRHFSRLLILLDNLFESPQSNQQKFLLLNHQNGRLAGHHANQLCIHQNNLANNLLIFHQDNQAKFLS